MKKKLLAAVLCLVMALSLFVPALGATPMMDGAVAETPTAEAGHAHTHAVAETPAVNDAQQAATLAAETHTWTATGGATDSYFTVNGTVSGGNLPSGQNMGGYVQFTVSGKATVTVTAVGISKGAPGMKKDGALVSDDEGKSKDGNRPTAGTTVTFTYSNQGAGTYQVGNIRTSGSTVGIVSVTVAEEPACEHAWSVKSTTAATCTADGTTVYQCSKCSDTKTETLPALGHTWNAGEVTKAATCTEPGVKTYTCTVCTAKKTEVIDPAHKFGSDGVCTVCHQHQHKWDSGSVTTPATCGEEGEMTYHCTVTGCTETDTQSIPATGKHTFKNGVCSVCGARETTGFLTAAGDLESAYALWPIGAGVTKYEAYVIDASGKEAKVDAQLVREYPGYMRVDALGLKAGKYTIKVVDNNGKEMTTDPLTVKAHDRSGFAFVGGTASGAYNNDGTLKSDTHVVYVTTDDELKALLNKESIWSGKTEKTTCVRIIGHVKAEDVFGFQDWTSGLTVEGVGNDATLTGGGVFVKGSSNVEVRNLAVFHVHSGGKNDLIAIEQKNDHIWVHNCDLYYGFSGGGDQAKGDGSLDVKDTNYSTFSYNHFWDSGKCSLLGNNSSEDYITYHHNWFDHSDSRHPRIRGGVNGGNIHIYNNYYDGNSKYGVGTTSGKGGVSRASVFIEANYFRNTKYPIMNSKQASDSDGNGGSNTFSGDNPGFNKVWNNVMVGSKNFVSQNDNPDSFDGYVVSSRSEKVPSTVKAGESVYNNFDTTIDLGVTASQIESPADARLTVTQWAGRVQGGDLVWEFDNDTDDTSYAVIKELDNMLTNYKTKLVSIGGTVTNPVSGGSTPAEHTHVPGTWTIVTTPGCDPETQEVVNGQETQSCTICGQVITTRSVPGAHSNDGSGKCAVCGKTVANNEGPGASTSSGPTLQAKNFKMTATALTSTSKNQEDLLASEIAGVADGYFSLTPGAKNVYKRTKDATTTGATTEWIQLPKEGTGGIQFTVKNGPATLKVKFSSSSAGDDKKTAAIVVKDASGKAVADKDGKTPSVTKKTSKESNAITVTFENLAAGTYQILGAPSSGTTPQTARVYSVTVVEAEATCEHETATHHPAVDATCVEDGNIEYWTCDTCKKNFSDEACTKFVDDVTVEATGEHTWSEWSESDENGEQSRYCEVCDEEETRLGGNLGTTGNEVTWVLDDAGKLTITNTGSHIATDDVVLVALWGDNNKFLGVKLIKASQLNATVGRSWDHLKLIWVNSKYAPKCDDVTVNNTQ